MTNEQWNTLEAVKQDLELWVVHRMTNTQSHNKHRIDWLCGEFHLQPTEWGCGGCIASRKETLYKIYKAEHDRRETRTTE